MLDKPTPFVWDEQAESTLKAMFMRGETSRAIAQVLGTTRNAILGKVHRMGLDVYRDTARTQSVQLAKAAMESKANRRRIHTNNIRADQSGVRFERTKQFALTNKITFAEAAEILSERERQARKLAAERRARKAMMKREKAEERNLRLAAEGNLKTLDLSFVDLEPGQCKFPTNDDHPFTFCGHPVKPGKPYCPHHWSVCNNGTWTPVRRKKVAGNLKPRTNF